MRNNFLFYIGQVITVEDDEGADRIRARIVDLDNKYSDEELPLCFPLLPKMLHIKPKKNEAVLILTEKTHKPDSQRFYIGPIISQDQNINFDDFYGGATNAFNSGKKSQLKSSLKKNSDTNGAFAKNEEIAIYGRKNSDIILSNDDIRIRCGCRLLNTEKTTDTSFNKVSPSFIKLKYYEDGIGNAKSKTTATIVADEINLIPNEGGYKSEIFTLTDSEEQITDKEMANIVNKAHQLPYGDTLVDFLSLFLQMFKSHTHRYTQLPPVYDGDAEKLFKKYGEDVNVNDHNKKISASVQAEDTSKTFSGLAAKLLSPHVRIN